MTRGILIAGNESSLLSAIGAEVLKRVESYASSVIPNRFPLPESTGGRPANTETAKEAPSPAIPLAWNPASPISARTMVLAADNRLGQINDAILICMPPAVYKTTEDLLPEEIDILLNDHIKGWFYLIRELTQYFRRAGGGALSLVAPEPSTGSSKNAQTDILGPSAAASFHAFTQGIITSSANANFRVMGFSGYEAGAENDFASWLAKIIDEGSIKNSGRWHRYSKIGFFR